MTKNFAGNVTNASIQIFSGTPVLVGDLATDLRGRFPEDSTVRTSWIVSAYWDKELDVLVVETRNSVYNVSEDLIFTQLNTKLGDGIKMSGSLIKELLTSGVL